MNPKISASWNRAFIWAALGWLALNLLQSALTELFHDEAYYWMFSRHLSVAYFEHPGMIAWLIAATAWIPGELGVRLAPVLVNFAALGILVYLTEPKDRSFTLLVISGIIASHIGGFFAAPDAPLALFAAGYFWALRRFLLRPDWPQIAWLALMASLMLYSKYHGALLVAFTFLAIPRWLIRWQVWAAGALSLLFCLPLLYHLYEQQGATFAFHLGSRVRRPWDIEFLWAYLSGQVLLYGPLLSLLLIPGAWLHLAADDFERALKGVVIGMLLFLLALSFRTWVEANWSAGMYVPLVWLGVKWIRQNAARQRWARWFAVIGIGFALFARVALAFPAAFPQIKGLRNEVHGWKAWAERVSELAEGRPVAVANSYGLPAKYTFYTGGFAFALNNVHYHRTQYEEWQMEPELWGKEVLYVTPGPVEGSEPVGQPPGKNQHYKRLPDFWSFNQVRLDLGQRSFVARTGDTLEVELSVINGYPFPIHFDWSPEPVTVCAAFFNGPHWVANALALATLEGVLEAPRILRLQLPVTLPPGAYKVVFTLHLGDFNPGINGALLPFQVLP